ncbi:COG4653 Predicted phage phi-C31 gp36 major capsid-like protein [uncultured Caudovirales phage]|uniref:COG4653 Predicted phage phi-C31 gp36 major capsid-like protein n=1 Tax=uncultured Caudovirales phage TaxID=2100421 RepID=A0A6J7WPJ8_9CAUD|nr:COG4653 Predicted phage phi-C31 gp36 major capsid-like protein [uncultured Caudovirales phage]
MSDFIAKQVDAKAKAWHEAKELIDSVEARGGVWSGEDEAKYASLTADINKRNELIELEQREAKTAEVVQAAVVNFRDSSVTDSEGDILRKMIAGEIRGHEFRAITGSSTGAPVPTSFYNEIVKVARLVNPLLDYATVINTASGENLQIPSQSTFSTATIVGQGSSIGTSEPTFNAFTTLSAYKFSALAQLSRELVLDAGVDIVGFLAEQFGNAFGYAIGNKLVNGTGTVEPTGFLPVAGTGVTGSTGVAGAFTADNIVDLVYSLDGALRNKPSFALLANSGSIAAMRKLKDSYGRYLFDIGLGQDKRDLVLGVPVIETPAMPSIGVGASSVAVGDLKALYIRNAGGLQVDRSDDYAFGNDLATWRATWRIDGALVQTANIKKFKGGAS